MVFIRKHQQPARHPLGLQHVERGQALGNRQPVVKLAVDNQLRRRPLPSALGGIPTLVTLPVLPQSTPEVVNGEEELLCRPLVQGTENPIVAYECLELAP